MVDRYAVIGSPIAQSKSPFIHAAFAARTGEEIHYDRIDGTARGFRAEADAFRAAGGRGLNVTAPFKLDAAEFATVRHHRATLAGAANCLRFGDDIVEAENFDGIGLLRDLQVNLRASPANRRVLVVGAGGAVRGALEPLLAAGPSRLAVVNRTRAKAAALADVFSGVEPGDLGEADRLGAFDLVINATSAGLRAEALTLPPSVFAADAVAYDMTYGMGLTGFLRLAREAGAGRLYDGVGMLVEQAAEAFAWWRGVRPDTRDVIARLTVPLDAVA